MLLLLLAMALIVKVDWIIIWLEILGGLNGVMRGMLRLQGMVMDMEFVEFKKAVFGLLLID